MTQIKVSALDKAIMAVYSRSTAAADDILTDPPAAIAFALAVRREMLPAATHDDRTILKRLMALRKRGQDHGGLPRLQRSYRGRGSLPR